VAIGCGVMENGAVILDTNMAEEQVGIVPFSELHRTGGIYSVPCMMGV